MDEPTALGWRRAEMADGILSHLVRRLEQTPLRAEPFPHLVLERTLPTAVYAAILSGLPDQSLYHYFHHPDASREDGTSTRSAFPLDTEHLDRLDGEQHTLWSAVARGLSSELLKKVLFEKFAFELSARFGVPAAEVSRIESYPHVSLLRDQAGYEVSPHPDTKRKIVTFLLYLPMDEGQIELGTTLYRPCRSATTGPGRKLKAQEVEPAETVPFLPNVTCAFAVTNRSWHGRGTVPTTTSARNTLTLLHYIEPGHGY